MRENKKGFIQKALQGFALLTAILFLFLVLRSCCTYCYGEFCDWLGEFLVKFDAEIRRFIGY